MSLMGSAVHTEHSGTGISRCIQSLLTIANMPIKRYFDYLRKKGPAGVCGRQSRMRDVSLRKLCFLAGALEGYMDTWLFWDLGFVVGPLA